MKSTCTLGPAHTDGDLFVVFPAAGVVHVGDVIAAKAMPIIDINHGGSGREYPQTLASAIAGIRGVHTVIPGHAGLMTWADVVDYQAFVATLVDYVRANMDSGMPKSRVFKAFRAPDRFKTYDLTHTFDTLDEIHSLIRPWWERLW